MFIEFKQQRKYLNKVILLLVTAAPGVFKIANLFVLKYLYSGHILSLYLNDIFINQIILIFTGISWSTLILTDLNKGGVTNQFEFFKIINFYGILYCIPSVVVMYGLFRFGWIVDFFGSCIYLIATTCYQNFRMFYIAQKRYNELMLVEIVILALSVIFAWLFFSFHLKVLIGQSLSFLFIFLFLFVKEKRIDFLKVSWQPSLIRRNIFNSLTNFTTGSISLFFTPLTFHLLSTDQTNIVGMVSYFVTVLTLIPRSFSYSETVKMSYTLEDRIGLMKIYERFNRRNLYINLGAFISTAILAIIFAYTPYISSFTTESNIDFFLLIAILMTLSGLTSQIVLPISNLFVIKEKEHQIFAVNLFSFLLFIFLYLCLDNFLFGVKLIMAFQVLMFVGHLFRYFMLICVDRKFSSVAKI